MIDINSSLDLGTDFTGFKFVDNKQYLTLRIIFTNCQLTFHMKEDQAIELVKVLQDHFLAKNFPIPKELTPGEVTTIEEEVISQMRKKSFPK